MRCFDASRVRARTRKVTPRWVRFSPRSTRQAKPSQAKKDIFSPSLGSRELYFGLELSIFPSHIYISIFLTTFTSRKHGKDYFPL